jgi:hypothetical protein
MEIKMEILMLGKLNLIILELRRKIDLIILGLRKFDMISQIIY